MSKRTIKRVVLPIHYLIRMVTQGEVIFHGPAIVDCVEGVPADAVLVDVKVHDPTMDVLLTFYHPSFEVVPFYEAIPMVQVQLRERSIMPEGEEDAGIETVG